VVLAVVLTVALALVLAVMGFGFKRRPFKGLPERPTVLKRSR
jgi:hypothetical protein